MLKSNHLVSVLITTHNRVDLLGRAIDSVMNQTYKNIELIVIDDGSSDDTSILVNTYTNKFDNIKYIKHEKPLGANVARNNGIKLAKGYFVAGLDDVDEFFPTRIEKLVNNYSDKYSLITSNDLLIFDNNKSRSTKKPEIVSLDLMLEENLIGNQVLVKKEYLNTLNGFDEKLTASQDYDMWIRIIQKFGDALVLKEDLQKIYLSTNIKRISTIGSKKFSGYFNFYKKFKTLMNKKQRKKHLSMLYFIRNKNMSINIFFSLLSLYTIKQFLKKILLKG